LYDGVFFHEEVIGDEQDYCAHDIRKLVDLLWKANISFLEVLYSKEITFGTTHLWDYKTSIDLDEIFNRRDELVKMNLPYLYNSVMGMHIAKIKRLDHPTEKTADLLHKHGYNTKEALHAYRLLDFLQKFADSDFTDFKSAIEYSGEDYEKMMKIKNGYYNKNDFLKIIEIKNEIIQQYYKEKYLSQKPDELLKIWLKNKIKSIVYWEMR
jgi:predicted nucleotidyltransferase